MFTCFVGQVWPIVLSSVVLIICTGIVSWPFGVNQSARDDSRLTFLASSSGTPPMCWYAQPEEGATDQPRCSLSGDLANSIPQSAIFEKKKITTSHGDRRLNTVSHRRCLATRWNPRRHVRRSELKYPQHLIRGQTYPLNYTTDSYVPQL